MAENTNLRPIEGWPTYFISDRGEVVRLKGNKSRTLKGGVGARGYRLVTLCNGSKRKNGMIHRLVAEAFLGMSNLQVNHKNGIKTDNRLENLEYCNQSENIKHAHSLGLITVRKGFEHHSSFLLETEIEVIKALRGDIPQAAIAALFDISQPHVCAIQKGRK